MCTLEFDQCLSTSLGMVSVFKWTFQTTGHPFVYFPSQMHNITVYSLDVRVSLPLNK